MRFKLLGLFGLAVATACITTVLVPKATAQRPAPPAKPSSVGIGSAIVAPGLLPFGPQQHGQGVITSAAMHVMSAEVLPDNVIHVAARASIMDRRPEMTYCWGIRVFSVDNSKEILFEKRYIDQMFKLDPPAMEVKNVTFEDDIKTGLPAGKYRVELSAFVLTPLRNDGTRHRAFDFKEQSPWDSAEVVLH